MEKTVTNGLVIKQVNYGEADRILHIFTEEFGIISALAKGARKYKSHQGGAAQLLYYSQFTLAQGKGMYRLQGANVLTSFFDLSFDLEKLALCNYFFDITMSIVPEHMPDQPVLSLLLNTLYILQNKPRPLPLIKAAYELKLLSLAGFCPILEQCCICGAKENLAAFSAGAGGVVCQNCRTPATEPLPPSVYTALKYITSEDASKIYSFSLKDDAQQELCSLCEKYLLQITEKMFPSLTYYKQIRS